MQTGKNLYVNYKAEATFNTAPGTGSGYRFRLNPSPGLAPQRAIILPGEVRADLQTPMARLGSGFVQGSYNSDLSVASFDPLWEALARSTYVAAISITQATMTSITTTTSTIVAAAGSWITQGVRAGDVVRLTGHATTANNSKNFRVKTVTASTITVYGTPLVLDAVADTSFTLTVLKKVMPGTTPTRRSFYLEEYNQDSDVSEVFGGCRLSSLRIQGGPDQMATGEWGFTGASITPLASGSSPYYISPTQSTSIGLTLADASIALGGSDVVNLTGFELNFDLGTSTQAVIGSNVPPDVFDGQLQISGSISAMRDDLTMLTNYANETELELHVLMVEPEAEPKDCIAIYLPRVKLTSYSKNLGGDGALIQTLPFVAGLRDAATGYDSTMFTLSTSAA